MTLVLFIAQNRSEFFLMLIEETFALCLSSTIFNQ